jgi:hypothetical protein
LEPLWLYGNSLSEHLFERYQAPLTRNKRVVQPYWGGVDPAATI